MPHSPPLTPHSPQPSDYDPDALHLPPAPWNQPPIPTDGQRCTYVVFSQQYPKPIEWFWYPLIPKGKVTLLVGPPGVGKSLFAVDLAARVTRGEAVPPGQCSDGPGRVFYLAGDHEFKDILPARLAAFGADMSRVAGIDRPDWEFRPHKDIQMFSLADDIEVLWQSFQRWKDCRLFIIDPITAFTDGIHIYSNMDVRRLLLRLASIAQDNNMAVVIISHFRKTGASSQLNRIIGSPAFGIVGRVILQLIKDPGDTNRRLLLPDQIKLLPQSQQHGRAFTIETDRIVWDEDPVYETADDHVELVHSGDAVTDHVAQVAAWLEELLRDGRRRVYEVKALAHERGIPPKVLSRGRKLAAIQVIHEGRPNHWFWQLPPAEDPFLLPDLWPPTR